MQSHRLRATSEENASKETQPDHTDSLQDVSGNKSAESEMMSIDQRNTILRLHVKLKERLDPERLIYPDGIEPSASLPESAEVLVKMIADDDEAEVTEADAMRLIDMINAEIMQRNVIHEDFRTKRLKSMMREIADAQRAANELQAHVSAAESQAAKDGYGKDAHIGEDGDIFFDISPPAKQSDKAIALALPKDSTPALREAVKAYVIASENGKIDLRVV